MLSEKLPHMNVLTMKLVSFVALVMQFMCLAFLGQDNDVLQPDPLT
jgi:hypothetical protein